MVGAAFAARLAMQGLSNQLNILVVSRRRSIHTLFYSNIIRQSNFVDVYLHFRRSCAVQPACTTGEGFPRRTPLRRSIVARNRNKWIRSHHRTRHPYGSAR